MSLPALDPLGPLLLTLGCAYCAGPIYREHRSREWTGVAFCSGSCRRAYRDMMRDEIAALVDGVAGEVA